MRIRDLDLAPHVADSLARALARPQGLVLICGPTGAGKTATVTALLEGLAGTRRIVTPDVTEPVSTTIDRGGVIDIVDIRSTEAAQMAAELAGRAMVLAVLRGGRSHRALDRLRDMRVSSATLERAEPVIVTQALCRRLCMYCREPVPTAEESLRDLEISPGFLSLTMGYAYEARGCTDCDGGYSGAVPIYEVLVTHKNAVEGLRLLSEANLLDDGVLKLLAGQTTLSELRRVLPRADEPAQK